MRSCPSLAQHGGMTTAAAEHLRSQWQELLQGITKDRAGDDVTIEVLSQDLGDGLELERLPLASLSYDPKDDLAIVAVGGRDGRLPVVLRHFVEHPQQIVAEEVQPGSVRTLEIVGGDGDRTFVTLHPPSADAGPRRR